MTSQAPPPAVSVVVVAHNSGVDLARCVASVRREVDRRGEGLDVVIVDNASVDGAAEGLAAEPGVTVLRNDDNRGFGPAVNQGWRRARGQRVLLLNPDARLREGSLDPLLGALDADPAVALAAPRLFLADGRVQESPRNFYDLAAVLARRTPFGRLARGRVAARRHLPPGDRPADVDWVTGAAMLLDRDAVPERGPFDERYFLYFEDVDLCRRLAAQGRSVRFAPDAAVDHDFAGGSRRQVPWNPLLWHHLRSAGQYAVAWSGGWWRSRWWRFAARRVLGVAAQGAALIALAGGLGLVAPVLSVALALLVLPWPQPGVVARAPLVGLPLLVLGLSLAGLAGSGASQLMGAEPAALGPLASWVAGGAMALWGLQRAARATARWLRRRGLGHRSCLVAGPPEAARQVVQAMAEAPEEALQFVGWVPTDEASGGPTPRLEPWREVLDVARRSRAEVVLVSGSPDDLAAAAEGVHALRQAGVAVAYVHTGAAELLQQQRPSRLGALPALPLGAGPSARVEAAASAALQRVAAGAGLVLLAPALAALGLLARLRFGGAAFVAHPRVGRGAAPFGMWRLRTGGGALGATGGGWLGGALRRLHLDELPQLWNVVRGQMRLVGPRPVAPDVARTLRGWGRARFAVAPGITGMWQLDRLRRWRLEQMITSDLLYLLRWSPSLDLRILAETLLGRSNP